MYLPKQLLISHRTVGIIKQQWRHLVEPLNTFENDLASTSTLALADSSIYLPSSATISAAARHLARPSTSPLTISPFDRIPAHRSQPLYSIPHTRGVHIFFPNAAASHALSTWSTPSVDVSSDVAALEVSALSAKRRSVGSNDRLPSSADYVPLWNASATSNLDPQHQARRMLTPDSFEHHMDSLSLLPADTAVSIHSGSSLFISRSICWTVPHLAACPAAI